MNTQEFLSNDILEDEYLNSYKPLSCVQMILGSCRVYIKDKFMTSPTIYQKLYTVLCIIITIVLYLLSVNYNSSMYYKYNTVYCLIICVTGLDLISHIFNIFHVRFINCESNVDFYLTLQRIDRLMKIDRNKAINDILYKVNIITVMFIVGVFIISFVGIVVTGEMSFLYFFGLVCGQITFLLDMIDCSNIMLAFFIRMRFLNAIIKNHVTPINSHEHLDAFCYVAPTKKLMRHLAVKVHDFRISSTDVYLHEIFRGFKKFQYIYRFQVCIFCGKLVFVTLLGFEFALFAAQKNVLHLTQILGLITYTTTDFLIALFLSVRCEVFFKELKETKRLCIGVMLKYQEGPLRQKARKMLKMIEESPPRFSVYDMWNLDAHIFVKILSLVTTLMVTLLQFAFL